MKLRSLLLAPVIALAISGCAHLYTAEELEKMPYSYFENKPIHLQTRLETKEYFKRMSRREQQLDMEAACVFGSRPAIDRSKLHCERVEGSPEWKKLHGN